MGLLRLEKREFECGRILKDHKPDPNSSWFTWGLHKTLFTTGGWTNSGLEHPRFFEVFSMCFSQTNPKNGRSKQRKLFGTHGSGSLGSMVGPGKPDSSKLPLPQLLWLPVATSESPCPPETYLPFVPGTATLRGLDLSGKKDRTWTDTKRERTHQYPGKIAGSLLRISHPFSESLMLNPDL